MCWATSLSLESIPKFASVIKYLKILNPNQASKKTLIDNQNLNFDLIVDSDTEIHQLYGAWGEKKNYGKVYMGAIRSTFIIGQDGIIQWCGKGVKSKGHVERLLKILNIENQ